MVFCKEKSTRKSIQKISREIMENGKSTAGASFEDMRPTSLVMNFLI